MGVNRSGLGIPEADQQPDGRVIAEYSLAVGVTSIMHGPVIQAWEHALERLSFAPLR